ncbi:MAG: M1 family metallopeptidase [Planctomycetota bacterium]
MNPHSPCRIRTNLGVALILALAAGCVAFAQDAQPVAEDPRIDSKTGALNANWPPDVLFDHRHMKLQVDLGGMTEARFTGVQTLTLAARGKARSVVELDCGKEIKIESIRLLAADAKSKVTDLKFTHEEEWLTIDLPEAAEKDVPFQIETTYSCTFEKNRRDGLTWLKGNDEATSETDKSPMIYSQGEAEHNHLWFPCHDFPNERTTTEIIAKVPKEYEVSSNGRLVSKNIDETTGVATFHWLQDKPHVYYLVTMVVGKYSIINLAEPGKPVDQTRSRDAGGPLPVLAYVPIGKEEQAGEAMANTPQMIALFSRLFEQPYPWDKYAQVLVRTFNGGMENTSATTMFATLGNAKRGQMDDIVSHELAHQWFGDFVTCRGWEHLWLNEGWASYCEALWNEEAAGGASNPDAADKRYLGTIAGFVSRQRLSNRGSLPRAIPMVSNRYRNADAPFQKPDDVYSKGACVLHMLRERLGKPAFYKGVARYLRENQLGLGDTTSFRKALEAESGQSLEHFFAQWAYRPGLPRLDVKLDFTDGTLTIDAEQTQTVNIDNPAYEMAIPVVIKLEGGGTRSAVIEMEDKTARLTLKLDTKPTDVVLDPRIANLAVYRISKPLAMWMEQLKDGPTVIAQAQAAEALAQMGEPGARQAITRLIDDPTTDPILRDAASGTVVASHPGH